MIAIIDYDVGNLKNVYTALKDVDLEGVITRDPKVVDNAEAIILPGVGAFSLIKALRMASGQVSAIFPGTLSNLMRRG